MSMCVSAYIRWGTLVCACLMREGVRGLKDGNAIAGYTGKELPRSAQRVKPAPQALMW